MFHFLSGLPQKGAGVRTGRIVSLQLFGADDGHRSFRKNNVIVNLLLLLVIVMCSVHIQHPTAYVHSSPVHPWEGSFSL